MAHGQGVVDLLTLLQNTPEGLTLAEIKKAVPTMKSGLDSVMADKYVNKIKPNADSLRRSIYKITPKGCKLVKYYEDNPDKIMKTRLYKKKAKPSVIEPQLYHDPVAQQYIEDMARPVAWSSSLSSTLRDINIMTQKIIDTEDIPQGDSDLDNHNIKQLKIMVKINKISNAYMSQS